MKNISNLIKLYIIIYYIIFNIIQQKKCYCYEYKIQAYKNEYSLEPLNIINNSSYCDKLIPSLFNPILITSYDYAGGKRISIETVSINIPFYTDKFIGNIYYAVNYFLNIFQIYFIKSYLEKKCLFGLSMSYPNDTYGLNESEVTLSLLKEKKQINQKVFSFDKFNFTKNTIETIFYLGEVHEHFTSNKGIIGTIKLNEEDIFWGFSFKEMILNNKIINLERTKDNKLYKIYLTTENYDITFPRELINETTIGELFDNKCEYNRINKYFVCNNFFNGNEYIPLKLISNDMNITLELDNFHRYYSNNDNTEEIIKIIPSDNNYIIFPLIMFKQFHVQFDAEKKVINFYTTDSSIISIKEEKKPTNNEDSSSSTSSYILTIILVILIILFILGIGFGIFILIRKRKSNFEKDINNIDKIKVEDEYKKMDD